MRERLTTFVRSIARLWLPVVTAAVLLLALAVLAFSENLEQAAYLATFISGFAAALAFLWLIASFLMQSSEIALQREELRLQRLALELQAKELRNASKFSSLSQISEILNRGKDQISLSGLRAKSPSDLMPALTSGLVHWKSILESTNAQQVFDASAEWMKVEVVVRGYIAAIAMGLNSYLEYFLEKEFDKTQSDEEFVYINHVWMNNAPYLSEHSGVAYMISNMMVIFQPGLKAIQVAWLVSAKSVLGKDLLKEGALEKLKQELEEKGFPLPAIAKD